MQAPNKYSFVVESWSDFSQKTPISWAFEPFLFHLPQHIRLQAEQASVLYMLKNKQIEAICYIWIEEEEAYSPLRMPFGGIACSERVTYEQIALFVNFIEDFCKIKKIRRLSVTACPFSYTPETSHILTQIYLHRGYRVSKSEITHFIKVNTTPFEEMIHISEKRKLYKCRVAQFSFSQINEPDMSEIYDFIAACRLRKGFPMSMNFESFEMALSQFKDKYLVFAVRNQTHILALSVVIWVHSDILYNFYPADHPSYHAFSPTVMLTEGIYGFCQQNRIPLLDLGISTDQGKPNFGLIRFKQYLGAKSSLKLSFTKNIEAFI